MVRRTELGRRGHALVVVLALAGACDDASSSSVGGGGGAGGAPGIGTPSDVYPAPHAAPPRVVHAGGPILASPTMVPVVFPGDDPSRVAIIESLAASVAASDYWAATTAEYGVGPLVVHPTVHIDEAPPSVLSPAEIEAWISARLDAADGSIPAPFAGAVYVLFYPASVSIEDGASVACVAYSGYHASVNVGGADVAYAVVPACDTFYGRSALETLSSTTTHELIEAATDPYASAPAWSNIDADHAYWTFVFGGGEVSDMCNLPLDSNVTLPGTTFRVQRSWSNTAALAGRDPCVPPLPGAVYFAAAPDLDDDVLLPNGVTSKGIRIAKGKKRTVDVRLFSEAPTAPIRVIAEDYESLLGGPPQLSMAFDEDRGLNGQTLHLTIEVVGDDATQLFRLSATDGAHWTSWIGAVGR